MAAGCCSVSCAPRHGNSCPEANTVSCVVRTHNSIVAGIACSCYDHRRRGRQLLCKAELSSFSCSISEESPTLEYYKLCAWRERALCDHVTDTFFVAMVPAAHCACYIVAIVSADCTHGVVYTMALWGESTPGPCLVWCHVNTTSGVQGIVRI